MPLAKVAATLVVAVVAASVIGFETTYLAARAFDRLCKVPSETCALSSPFFGFFGLVAGAETFIAVLGAGALRIGGRSAAAWIVATALVIVLVAEHAWLLT